MINEYPLPLEGKKGWPWTKDCSNLYPYVNSPSYEFKDEYWPKISIVIPNYNCGKYLEESIRSILLQDYPNLELIVIDGSSTDESIGIIQKYEKWIDYWVTEPDNGQSNAINKGLIRSTGELFNWHNADDILLPNSLKTAAKEFIKNNDLSYVFGHLITIDENSKIQFVNNKNSYLTRIGYVLTTDIAISNLKCGCQPGCLMNRNLVQKVGGIDENLIYAMDLDVLLRISVIKPSYYLDTPQVLFRVHSNSKSVRLNKERANDRLIIVKKIFSDKKMNEDYKKIKFHSFSVAHDFAYKNYFTAKMYFFAFWHLLNKWAYNFLDRCQIPIPDPPQKM